jgi:hypothetical protein
MVPGITKDHSPKHSWDTYHQAARMLPYFPWDDDPEPMVGTHIHHWNTTHHAARVLSQFPCDGDPGTYPTMSLPGTTSIKKCSLTASHHSARVLQYFPFHVDHD